MQPNAIANGYLTFGSDEVGSERFVSCRSGYRLSGTNAIRCLPSLQWTTPGICQQITGCGVPPEIRNAFVRNGNSEIGSSRTIDCVPPYRNYNYEAIRCGEDGQWSPHPGCM